MNHNNSPITSNLILGPCSAESPEQLFATANAIQDLPITYFRAGVWKPRTRPGHFEGHGEEALKWLNAIRKEFKLPIATEVANEQQMEAALNIGIDMVWIGARTTPNPFTIKTLANMTRGTNVAVYVKNPINADLNLWLGALERFHGAGVTNLAAIHRGFTSLEESKFRNAPLWQIPMKLKAAWQDLPILHDPSHIAGNQCWIPALLAQAKQLPFSGLMMEVHPEPEKALTDSKQQVTPAVCKQLIAQVQKTNSCQQPSIREIKRLRKEIDSLDSLLLKLLKERLDISEQIGTIKHDIHMEVFQQKRWTELIMQRKDEAKQLQLSSNFVSSLFECIHMESVARQKEQQVALL